MTRTKRKILFAFISLVQYLLFCVVLLGLILLFTAYPFLVVLAIGLGAFVCLCIMLWEVAEDKMCDWENRNHEK